MSVRTDADLFKAASDRALILPPGEPPDQFTGLKRRLAGFVWRFLGPSLQRQQEFNAAVLECVAGKVSGDLLSSVTDEMLKRWESITMRQQRDEAREENQARAVGEIRAGLATLQLLAHSLKKEMERLMALSRPAPAVAEAGASFGRRATDAPGVSESLDSHKYVGFEDQFRGRAEDIRANLADYVPLFTGSSDVLDLGCGRGEFLQLLSENAIRARGLDVNQAMVDACRARGLDAVQGDGVDYLASLPDGAIGGLFAAQVVEHLEPARLLRLLEVAYCKLRPGARVVLETINPACWAAFFESYIRDLTHVRPVHPDTLTFLLRASGFHEVEIHYRAPYPEHARLQPIAIPAPGPNAAAGDVALRELADRFNENIEKLNRLMFTHFDYAAVAVRR